ncbi:hypothetical protein Fmac_022404 [Flemingia macrophylla]|uniref:40S ribosomal protein S25 n=1 Tax=Flemingia macrophylla TaxID=520843 RepID=A0ABD1LZL4_9FABA
MAPKKDKAPPPSSKPAKSGGGKQKKKKWSKGKQKEKVNNMVLFDQGTYDKLLSEAPKYKLITPSILSDRLRSVVYFVGSAIPFFQWLRYAHFFSFDFSLLINGSLARKAIRELMARGSIRMIHITAEHAELFQLKLWSPCFLAWDASDALLIKCLALTHNVWQIPELNIGNELEPCVPSAPHPLISLHDGHLNRLKASEVTYSLLISSKLNGGFEAAFKVEGGKYLSPRKKAKKTIQKSLGKLKGFKKGLILTSSNTNNETLPLVSKFKEAEAVTLVQLETLLSFISGSRGKPKDRRWLIISKLMQPNRVVHCDSDKSNTNEFEVGRALQSLFHKTCSNVSVESFQNHMENLELCFQGVEAGIERLEQQLIRTRVSLVNIIIH